MSINSPSFVIKEFPRLIKLHIIFLIKTFAIKNRIFKKLLKDFS